MLPTGIPIAVGGASARILVLVRVTRVGGRDAVRCATGVGARGVRGLRGVDAGSGGTAGAARCISWVTGDRGRTGCGAGNGAAGNGAAGRRTIRGSAIRGFVADGVVNGSGTGTCRKCSNKGKSRRGVGPAGVLSPFGIGDRYKFAGERTF
ncbi:hypothetical protein Mame01_09000 [Microbispora amethystogenes]|nr:hypothetical protein Mame01_09000 [Microbispora amethystogenes]